MYTYTFGVSCMYIVCIQYIWFGSFLLWQSNMRLSRPGTHTLPPLGSRLALGPAMSGNPQRLLCYQQAWAAWLLANCGASSHTTRIEIPLILIVPSILSALWLSQTRTLSHFTSWQVHRSMTVSRNSCKTLST